VFSHIHLKVRKGAEITIGNCVEISSGDAHNPLCRNIEACLCAERPGSIIEIGDNSGLSSPCIWAKERITIGKRVKIGGDYILMDSDAHSLDWHDRASHEILKNGLSRDLSNAKTVPINIEDDVLIGTRCIILKGVTIGARSIIAAGSVVTKNIPSDCIAGGNPARVIQYINNNGKFDKDE